MTPLFASIINEMAAVPPRQKQVFHVPLIEVGTPNESTLENIEPYALFIMTPRLSSIPIVDVNARLVIVGTGDTTQSFLENLIFGPHSLYLRFRNLTIVAPHWFNLTSIDQAACDLFFPFKGLHTKSKQYTILIRAHVNTIFGIMTEIDRKEKLIYINDTTKVAYDYLFLMCGEQFQRPPIYKKQTETEQSPPKRHKNKNTEELFPSNVFIINTGTDAHQALTMMKSFTENLENYTVIVYGNVIESYCCVTALLKFGVSNKNIAFVQPPNKRYGLTVFNDGDIYKTVQNELRTQGITVYEDFYITGWDWVEMKLESLSDTSKTKVRYIKEVYFESQFRQICLQCVAMFLYNKKTISNKTFSAINRAGLVYDGRLVISSNCRTNDPWIFAAGSLTKYSRRYYANHLIHAYFNSVEIGSKLGKQIRKMLDPSHITSKATLNSREEPVTRSEDNDKSMLTARYVKPKVMFAILPGNIQYMSVSKPGKPIPIEAAINHEDYGQVLITGDTESLQNGFFRLHLNPNGIVETITCLTKDKIDIENMISLYGKHERMLNNLMLRFHMYLITDLFTYFREPWTCAIFHDRFNDFLKSSNDAIKKIKVQNKNLSLYTEVKKIFKENNGKRLTIDQKKYLQELYDTLGYDTDMEHELINFIIQRHLHLTMYAHPSKAKQILYRYDDSPLFENDETESEKREQY